MADGLDAGSGLAARKNRRFGLAKRIPADQVQSLADFLLLKNSPKHISNRFRKSSRKASMPLKRNRRSYLPSLSSLLRNWNLALASTVSNHCVTVITATVKPCSSSFAA
jgi:hypothetical protein